MMLVLVIRAVLPLLVTWEVNVTLGLDGNMLILQTHVQMILYIGWVWRRGELSTVPWGTQVSSVYGEKCWTLYRE